MLRGCAYMWLCGCGQEADVMPKDRKGEQLLVQKDCVRN